MADVEDFDLNEREVFAWRSLERVHKSRSKEFYSTILVLAVLLSIILFFIEGVMPVLVIWAIVFVTWVISKTPPQEISHRITSWGIRIDDNLYRFEEMTIFWFEEKWGKRLLRILLLRRFPGQLVMVVDDKDEDKIKKILGKYLPMQTPPSTWADKAVKWLSERVPLEES